MREETKARLEALMIRYAQRLAELRRKQELIRIGHDNAPIGRHEGPGERREDRTAGGVLCESS